MKNSFETQIEADVLSEIHLGGLGFDLRFGSVLHSRDINEGKLKLNIKYAKTAVA